MAERRRTREPPVRSGREHAWLFLRTLVGLFLVGWLLAALFAPPEPLTFLLLLGPLWVLAVPLSWWLTYRDGYDAVLASGYYRPGMPASRAVGAFVLTTAVLKVGITAVLAVAVGDRPAGVDRLLSAVALAVAYALVFGGGFARLGVGRG